VTSGACGVEKRARDGAPFMHLDQSCIAHGACISSPSEKALSHIAFSACAGGFDRGQLHSDTGCRSAP
jgi:hypothetical protein